MLDIETINDFAKIWMNGSDVMKSILVTELSVHWDMPEDSVRARLAGLGNTQLPRPQILETALEYKPIDLRHDKDMWIADVAAGILCAQHACPTSGTGFAVESKNIANTMQYMDKCVNEARMLFDAINRAGLKPWREHD